MHASMYIDKFMKERQEASGLLAIQVKNIDIRNLKMIIYSEK